MTRDNFIVQVVKARVRDTRRKALNARLKLARAKREGRPPNVMVRLENAAHARMAEFEHARRWLAEYDAATKPVVEKAEITALLDGFD